MFERISALAIVAAMWSGNAVADIGNGEFGWRDGHMMGWGGWFMGPIMMLIFLALLVGAIVLIARLLRGDTASRRDRSSDRPLEILRERFAKGEIDAEEFEARKEALRD